MPLRVPHGLPIALAMVFALTLAPLAAPPATLLWTHSAADTSGDDFEYLIVCDSSFLPQAMRLAEFRRRVSPRIVKRTAIASMEYIYQSFPPTGLRWTSLQAFLKAKVSPATRYVVLLGDADFREEHPNNLVPAFQQRIPSLTRWNWQDTSQQFHDTLISEDAYADYFDSLGHADTLRLPYAVGRIPAQTPAQADAYLDKLAAYEERFPYGPHAFTFGFLNDDDRQKGSFDDLDPIYSMPELHQAIWEALEIKPFVRRVLTIESPLEPDFTRPAAKDSLVAMLNQGPGRFFFIGHGSHSQLTDERVFEAPQDLTRLAPKPLPPIMSFLACTTARFAEPEPSLGEYLLFHPHGAVAVLGGTIPTYPLPNNQLFIAWNRATAGGLTLGDSFAQAKRENSDPRNTTAYVLLGDPALSMPVPAFDLTPAPGSGASRLVLQSAAGDSAYFQLVTVDSLPFNAVISPLNLEQRNRTYPRERVLAEGRAEVNAAGTVTFLLPTLVAPEAAAVKAMVWNARGMRYGHFPMESLATALRPVAARAGATPGLRMVVRGNRVLLERNGRLIGWDGRAVGPGSYLGRVGSPYAE